MAKRIHWEKHRKLVEIVFTKGEKFLYDKSDKR
jgi:hypothetical protein